MQQPKFDAEEYINQVREMLRTRVVRTRGMGPSGIEPAVHRFIRLGRKIAWRTELRARTLNLFLCGKFPDSNTAWREELEKKFRGFGRASEHAHIKNIFVPGVSQLSGPDRLAVIERLISDFIELSGILETYKKLPVIYLSPEDVAKIINTNSDLPRSAVVHLIKGNPIDVNGAIDRFRENVRVNSDANPDLPPNVIARFAISSPDDIAGAIVRYRKNVRDHSEANPDLSMGIIGHFVQSNPTDIAGAIVRYRKDVRDHSRANPDLPVGIVATFVRGNPTDIAGAIVRFREDVRAHMEANPDLPKGLITRFARGNPGNVGESIKKWKSGQGPKTNYEYLFHGDAGIG